MPCKEEEDDSQISQNLNENLTEHEVVTWTVVQPQGDTLKVERVTDRTRESGSRLTSGRVCSRSEESKQASLSSRSTADFHVQDSKVVEEVTPTVSGKLSAVSKVLKWIFFILIGLIGLTITVKVCSLRR